MFRSLRHIMALSFIAMLSFSLFIPAHSVSAILQTSNTPLGISCPMPPNTFKTIPALQGTGDTNTSNGANVTVQGVVVGDFQTATGLNGFYIQDQIGDGNVATSDGVFIYVPIGNSTWYTFDVVEGNYVQVSGRATEFQGQTEIDFVTNIQICATVTPLAPTEVSLPETIDGELEQYEGMLVTIDQPLTVDQNFFQGRYGQVTLSAGGRLFQPTNQFEAGTPEAAALANLNARSLIVLDDAFAGQNPNPIPYIGIDNTLRAGDTIPSLTGIIDFGPINSNTNLRNYRVQPTEEVVIERTHPRTATPEEVGGNARVASFNVLNYFTTIDQSGASCFPSGTRSDCRGADSAQEFTRQRTKIINALVALNADVVGLMEIENNGPTAVGDLVNGLNAATAPGIYAAIVEPAAGGDAIKVAMIYKPGAVTPVGTAQNYQVANHPVYGQLYDRPPLAQTFTHNETGEVFTVMVNHFKSKGSCAASGPDSDQGDGQGCWNAKRTAQAEGLLSFINLLQTTSTDQDVIVIGDLNAYGHEDPIMALVNDGMNNLNDTFVGATAYSYVFDGLAGYLDHALSTASVVPQVSNVTIWHINADEPSVIDYNTEFKPQDLYSPTPYRSSDHDPVLIGLRLGDAPADVSGSEKLVNTTTITAGDMLTYTLVVSNAGALDTTFTLTDVLDANLTVVSAEGMTVVGQTVAASGVITGNTSLTYTLVVEVDAGFSGDLDNTATLQTAEQTISLVAPTVTVAAGSAPADVSGSEKLVNTTTITAGDMLTYTLVVSNAGALDTTFTLTDVLDANLTVVSAESMTVVGQTVAVGGVITANTTLTYTLVVEVDAGFSGDLDNTAILQTPEQTISLVAPTVTVDAIVVPDNWMIFLPVVRK